MRQCHTKHVVKPTTIFIRKAKMSLSFNKVRKSVVTISKERFEEIYNKHESMLGEGPITLIGELKMSRTNMDLLTLVRDKKDVLDMAVDIVGADNNEVKKAKAAQDGMIKTALRITGGSNAKISVKIDPLFALEVLGENKTNNAEKPESTLAVILKAHFSEAINEELVASGLIDIASGVSINFINAKEFSGRNSAMASSAMAMGNVKDSSVKESLSAI